jgi:D-alanyl-D-alanine carboxypeptidase
VALGIGLIRPGIAAVVTLGVLAAGCYHAAPSPPAPGANGRFPADSVVAVTQQCQVAAELADQLGALLVAAEAAGVGLAPETSSYLPPGVAPPPRIESCYRTYDMQVWWRTYYCSISKCGNAAQPGTSKHGWGHAVDFEDRLGELTFTSPGYQWLVANAGRFGFFQPESVQQGGANEEAWHWEAR